MSHLARPELFQVPPVDPIGPMREALSSLLIRTARENDVSPGQLLERKFHRQGPNGSIHFTGRALGSTVGQSMNGHGTTGAAFVKRTEEITALENLAASTVRGFSKFTTPNGLFRDRFAWSPEFVQKSETPYHPLVWMLEPGRVCPATRKPLISACPSCRKKLSVYPGSGYAELCCHCGTPFSVAPKTPSKSDPICNLITDFEYEIWISEQLGEAIATFAQGNELCPTNFSDCLKHWMDRFELRGWTQTARVLGVSSNSVSNWMTKGQSPRLRVTLNLCWVFGLSLRQFLQKDPPSRHPGTLRAPKEPKARYAATSRRRPIDRVALKRDLEAIIKNNRFPLLSLREICERKLERRELVVRDYFPDLAKQIAQRNKKNRHLRARVARASFCAEIREFSRILHEQGVTPNYKNLTPYMESPARLRCAWAIDALTEVRSELGYESTEEQMMLPI